MKFKVDSIKTAKYIIKKEKSTLVKNYGVSKIGIFGSFAFGDFTPESDIDVLIDLKKNNNLGYFKLSEIESNLSKTLGRKVDLVTINGLKPYIKNNILKSVIYV